MNDPDVLTPYTCSLRDYVITLSCHTCRVQREARLGEPAWLKVANTPLAQVWRTHSFPCSSCGTPASGLTVSRWLKSGNRTAALFGLGPQDRAAKIASA